MPATVRCAIAHGRGHGPLLREIHASANAPIASRARSDTGYTAFRTESRDGFG